MEYGVLSILPPLLAITLALATRDVLISLITGIFSGFLILNHFQPVTAILAMLDSIVALFAEGWVVKTLIFSLFVGSVMRLMVDSGGVRRASSLPNAKKSNRPFRAWCNATGVSDWSCHFH